VKHEVSRIK
jgi:hypothetical protein